MDTELPQSALKVGVIDLGSNTARLVVFAFEPGLYFRLVDEIREPVRLGEGLTDTGRLGKKAIARALAALRLYTDYARATGLDSLEVVATSAVRDAENRDELTSAIDAMGLSFSTLSGEEEAAVGVVAVANSTTRRNAWIIDLGGGSAQLSLMRDRRPVSCRSFPLGNVRLTERFLVSDPPTADQVAALEAYVAETLSRTVAEMKAQPLPIVAMGGTVRNLARAAQKADGYPLDLLHGYFLHVGALRRVVARLTALNAKQRARMGGIHGDRADVIAAGAVVFRWLLAATGGDGYWIAGQGIREGTFYRHVLPAPHLLDDVRRFSIRNLFHRFPQPTDHVRSVRRLSTAIFDALQPLHGCGPAERDVLDTAATLHDVGVTVNYYDHHRHGEYLLTSGPLPGFSHREQALIALLVRYHRKGNPKPRDYGQLLDRGDKELLRQLSVCLRLAEDLERSRAGRVHDVEVEIDDEAVTVTLLASEAPQVELWEAGKEADLFRRTYGRRLVLESRMEPAGAGD